jgi:hypothetical protein
MVTGMASVTVPFLAQEILPLACSPRKHVPAMCGFQRMNLKNVFPDFKGTYRAPFQRYILIYVF